jgi:ketohexokinase
MASILAIGTATLDIVNEVASYPEEDAEVRALRHTVRRGGNATNTLVVLSQLGHVCEWAGVWVDEPDARILRADLERFAIGMQYCRRVSEGKVPTSYITSSRASGSRTIVHYRELPELDFSSFCVIPLERFDWLHCEARNVVETRRMLAFAHRRHPGLPISVEVEKPREGVEALYPYARLLLFSRSFASDRGETPESLLRSIGAGLDQADLVCTLSEAGALGLSRSGEALSSTAYPPPQLVDTIGAGDTFNAGMIDALLRQESLARAMDFACRLAGQKCGQVGLDGLGREQ